ncbi:MAG: 30S ribosome-binding factor RbfA [Clostridiales bacterium]|nr:30S ribosome-binding factor RbfA [Clostridiales bacterium]
MKNVRLERINSQLQKEISFIIDNKIRDPQIDAIIGVSAVEITPDLADANVYITSLGSTPKEEVIARIKGAGSYIRKELAKRIRLRITPRLNFKLDTSEDYYNKIDNILKNITYSTESDEDEE